MIRAVVLLLALVAGPAAADLFPRAYQVTGVAANDVLNIRAEPSGSAPIVGRFGPYAISVEVIEVTADGKWGKVGLPEGNGWVAMRFLQETPPPPHEIPRPMVCFGTEPFWSLTFLPRGDIAWQTPEEADTLTPIREAVAREGYMAVLQAGPTLDRTLTITREACNDGMSDRDFGFAARLFTEAPDGNSLMPGCCTMQMSD